MKLPRREIHDFPPIWQRFGYFFSLLRRGESLAYIAGGSVVHYLQMSDFYLPLLFWLTLGYVLLLLSYVFDTLLRIAHGHLRKEGGPQIGYGGEGLVLPAIMVFALDYLLIGGLIWLLIAISTGAWNQAAYRFVLFNSRLDYLACLLLVPAQWVALARTRSVLDAMNPRRLADTVSVFGFRYMLILLLQLMLGLSCLELRTVVDGWLPMPLLALLSSLLDLASCLIPAAMIGYICLERHGDLDILVSAQTAKLAVAGAKPAAKPDPVADILAEVGVLIGSGEPRTAMRQLHAALERNWGEARLHEHYFKLTVMLGQTGDALAMARNYVTTLVHQEQLGLALDWYIRGVELAPTFGPANPGDLLLLASAAEQRGALAQALLLVERLLAEHERHPQREAALLFKERLLEVGEP